MNKIAGKVIQSVLSVQDKFSKPIKNARESFKKMTNQINTFSAISKKVENANENSIKSFKKVEKSNENSIKSFKELRENYKKLRKDEKVSKEFARHIKKMENDVKKSFKKMKKAVKSFSINQIKKATTAIKNLALATSGLALGGASIGILEGINYEGYKVQLETATKNTEKASKLMRGAIEFANKTPFETGQIIEATAKFESMGLSSEKWLTITADMAGATSKDVLQAVEAVIDAVSSNEFERLKEFGLSKKSLENMDKAGKIFEKGKVINQIELSNLLFSEMNKKFGGGAEKLSTTTKGLWSTVTGIFKNSMAKIMGITDEGSVRIGSSFASIKKVIKNLADSFLKWQTDGTIEKISLQVDNLIKKIKESFNIFLLNLPNIIKYISKAITIFIKLAPVILAVVVAVKALNIAMGIYSTIQAIIAITNPFALTVLGIVAIIGVIGIVTVTILVFKDKIIAISKNIAIAFLNIGKGIKNFFASILNFIISGINKLISIINKIPSIEIPKIPKIEKSEYTQFESIQNASGKNKEPIPKIEKTEYTQFESIQNKVPTYALGTTYSKKGLAQINERGGELVTLPSGAKVLPADKTNKLLKNATNTFNITINVKDANSKKIANEIAHNIKLKLANM